jgi:ricin-type beta-trefoil lectin protein
VGLTIYDNYGNIQHGTMYNNEMNNNVVGWMCWAARCAWDGYRADEYFPHNNSDYYANQTIPANPISLSLEEKEYETWEAKVSANSITVGPSVSAVGVNQGGGSSGSISTAAWYTIINSNSKLCVEAAAGLPDGVRVKQNRCGTAQATQEWQFQPTGKGYYRVINRDAFLRTGAQHVWDVTGGPWKTADGVQVQLWTYGGGTNQQWMPVSLGNGAWKFIVRSSPKCLDVPGDSSVVLLTLQQYGCNGTAAQSYTLQKEP